MADNKGILVVEDEMLLSLVYENYIKKLGFKTLSKVADGHSAIEATRKLDPDLILMDISLTGTIDGIEAMKEIRKFSKVPVIYITGNSDQYHVKRAEETNYVDYLIKPITIEDLRMSVKKIFD